MHKIFTVYPKDLIDTVRELSVKQFVPLERVLADRVNDAQLSLDVNKDTKRRHGRIFNVTGNMIVEGKHYNITVSAETLELALDKVSDGLIKLILRSHGRTMRLLRKGGAKIKKLLRFGHTQS